VLRRVALIGLSSALAAAGWLASASGSATAASSPVAVPYAWGDNTYGQFGDGSVTSSSVPVPATLPVGVTPVAVSEGRRTGLALGSDGNVYAWGDNQFGQLGDGSTADSPTPLRVSLPAGVTVIAVSEGFTTSVALGSDGTVYAWGSNLAGQLGDGTATGPQICGYTPCSMTPVAISLPGGVKATAVAEGLHASFALGSDGHVYAWGDNAYGQLGDGMTTGPQTCGGAGCSMTPVAISLPGGVTATAVSAGGATSLAIGSGGHIYAWGDNTYGQLGDGTTTGPQICQGSGCSLTPVAVSLPGGMTAAAVSAGGATSLAIGSDGHAYAWGLNMFGELGDGSTTDSSTPVLVSLPAGVSVTAVSAGGSTELAIGSDGSVYAWGDNAYGSLGDGSTAYYSTAPVLATLPSGTAATAVSEGSGTSLAIIAGGTAAPVRTTIRLGASPNPAAAGGTVTLTAADLAADGTIPAGSVQFQVGGTDIDSPVAVVNGLASVTTTFAAAGTEALSAVFIPASTTYAISAGELSLPVTAATAPGGVTGGELVTATVPATGTFTVTIGGGTVLLTVSGQTATGALQNVAIFDSRNDYPGWSVSGQESDFAGSGTAAGSAIPGNQLGWTPTSPGGLEGGAALGRSVAPAAPGLGTTAAVLASAGAGNGLGVNVLSANLTLLIPALQPTGPYDGTLTITVVESAP
jgi:alpha-tubulin suppressor-like RCC1 family protein